MLIPLEECRSRIFAHEKVACTVSGGKDSMAVAMYLEPFWKQITFLWSNPGDPLPETAELMDRFRKTVPNFVEVTSNVKQDHVDNGYPSDVVPENMTMFQTCITGRVPEFYIQHRADCCVRNFYTPLQNRLMAGGYTLIIRGEKEADYYRNRYVYDGWVDPNGVEYLLPAWKASTEEVLEYLQAYPQFLHPVYEYEDAGGIDCMSCTAWWEEISMPYLRKYHPEVAKRRTSMINEIKKNTIALLEVFD